MGMTPWEPFEELRPLRDAMNRLIEESFIAPRRVFEPLVCMFPVDVRELDDTCVADAPLPTSVDADKVTATYEHGISTLQIPRVEAAKAQQIKVQVKEPAPVQEQTFTIETNSVRQPCLPE